MTGLWMAVTMIEETQGWIQINGSLVLDTGLE